jgi:release factor glutamine methyltransferase
MSSFSSDETRFETLNVEGLSIDGALKLQRYLGSESPRADVERLLCHVLDCATSYLRTWPDKLLSPEQASRFLALLGRRNDGVPVAYLTGRQGFWNLDLEVNESTLIPRADTECLVEYILSIALPENTQALDLGTGTGAIALALASERQLWAVMGTDLNEDAVALARRNAERNHLSRVVFHCGSWFAAVPKRQCFDLIVSNPPYIDPMDEHLGQGDVRFEPLSALAAQNSGLADLELIARQSTEYLRSNGWIVLEHGYQQGNAVRQILLEKGFSKVQTFKDYGSNERFSTGQLV